MRYRTNEGNVSKVSAPESRDGQPVRRSPSFLFLANIALGERVLILSTYTLGIHL